MPKVSVIIPVYNVEKYLGECLDSILGQTLKDIEVLCIDDGATDSSADILANYAAKDARVKLFSSPHAGAFRARAVGVAVHAKLDARDKEAPIGQPREVEVPIGREVRQKRMVVDIHADDGIRPVETWLLEEHARGMRSLAVTVRRMPGDRGTLVVGEAIRKATSHHAVKECPNTLRAVGFGHRFTVHRFITRLDRFTHRSSPPWLDQGAHQGNIPG